MNIAGPGRRRSALDRLGGPVGPPPTRDEQLAPENDSPADDSDSAGPTDSADTGWSDDGWGIAPPPAWLDPVAVEDRDGMRMSVGDSFGELDLDDDEKLPRRRFAVAPPAAVALILIGVVACVVAGVSLLRGGGDPPAVVAFPESAGPTAERDSPAPSVASGAAAAGASTSSASSSELVVSVVGLVHKPGLVRVPGDARVADAIARAGGVRTGGDLLSLNLAQRLNDGDQILVGYAGGGRMSLRSAVIGPSGATQASPGGGSSGSGGSATGGSGSSGTSASAASDKIDLNTATEAQLDTLPGVGPVTAKAIIAWREKHGRFTSVEQLGEVDGIGPARLAKLRGLVGV
ncbi:ComEA family DNA-binding protein [Gordonia sp. CPCC 206044]|uniref:helix-hairpin-helix domain-containing protein n=1 Tax=Gordonia sp. CPCC 206044 TaxID=3140793 RepID=UPI003AF34BFA